MSPDILIVRDPDGYRILHGHLHLANALNTSNEIFVEVKDHGQVKVVKTPTGLIVAHENHLLPLLRN